MNQIVTKHDAAGEAIERVIAQGDLSKLSPEQRIRYYNDVCKSLDLNPLTRPFEYITLNGKLVLYARKDATEQLRVKRGISIKITAREKVDDVYLVTAQATDKTGRVDESIGAVSVANAKGDVLANSIMKCETKAKRRVTLSISGLGLSDESELETIPGAQMQRGNPIKAEADRLADEIESCGDREQLDAFMATGEVKDFLARAANHPGALNYADVTMERYWQHHAKLPEVKKDKRALVKTIDEYPNAEHVEKVRKFVETSDVEMGIKNAARSSADVAPAAPTVLIQPQGPSQPPDIPAALDRRAEVEEPYEGETITHLDKMEMDFCAAIDGAGTIPELQRVRAEMEVMKGQLGDRMTMLKKMCASRKREIEKEAHLHAG